MEIQRVIKNEMIHFEAVPFNGLEILCPVVDNEPYIIMNQLVELIGLNYNTAMEDLRANTRVSRFLCTLQFKNDKNDEIRHAVRRVSFEKKGHILEFWAQITPHTADVFDKTRGYKYTVLPVRKVASWLYGMSIAKVKPEIRQTLEKYQDECDDVLFDYFFGLASQRKKAISYKSQLMQKQTALEEKLKLNKDYQEYCDTRAEIMRLGKIMIDFDRTELTKQFQLFDPNTQF